MKERTENSMESNDEMGSVVFPSHSTYRVNEKRLPFKAEKHNMSYYLTHSLEWENTRISGVPKEYLRVNECDKPYWNSNTALRFSILTS